VGKCPKVEKWMSGGCDGNSSENYEESTLENRLILSILKRTFKADNLWNLSVDFEARDVSLFFKYLQHTTIEIPIENPPNTLRNTPQASILFQTTFKPSFPFLNDV
jgi:hypothetical protein